MKNKKIILQLEPEEAMQLYIATSFYEPEKSENFLTLEKVKIKIENAMNEKLTPEEQEAML